MRRLSAWLSLCLACTAFLVVATSTPATADDPECTWGVDGDGNYVCQQPGGPGEPGGPGGGGGFEPPCEFQGTYDDLCDGKNACWRNDPAAVQDPTELKGVPKPDPDAHVIYWSCIRPDGSTYDRWFWSGTEPSPPTLEERALQALGQIVLPTFRLSYSPPAYTLVNLDTWWWAQGPSDDVLGSSALGVRAVASPDRLEVDPGDGSDVMTCPVVVEKSDACTYRYRSSSRRTGGGDDHAYQARMRLVYTIHFEIGGTEVDVPGAPDELPTDWADRPIQVREVQSVVVPGR